MPEEKSLVWLLPFCNACKFSDSRIKTIGVTNNFLVMGVFSVMTEEIFLMWLHTFSNVCKFTDARRKIPDVTTHF